MNELTITKDGKKCKVKIESNGNGVKIKTEGKGCKKIMGGDYFDEINVGGDD